jgi:histidinol-phosphate aminotransferase
LLSSDYKDDGTNVLLDANENAYGPGLALGSNGKLANGGASDIEIDLLGLNRYPDPHQHELKQHLINLRNTKVHTQKDLTVDSLFVGVGSDEAIDALLRAFCTPGKDKILTCPPTYGMYSVSAHVNDVEVVKVPLDVDNGFNAQPDKINAKLAEDPTIKMVYLCSPGNPTANLVRKEDVRKVLEHPTWNGVVIVDEAYIDFSPDGSSLAECGFHQPSNRKTTQQSQGTLQHLKPNLTAGHPSTATSEPESHARQPRRDSGTEGAYASRDAQDPWCRTLPWWARVELPPC